MQQVWLTLSLIYMSPKPFSFRNPVIFPSNVGNLVISAAFVGLDIRIVSSSCDASLITPDWFSAKLWDKFDFLCWRLLESYGLLKSFNSNNGAVNRCSLTVHTAAVYVLIVCVAVAC